MAYRHIFLAVPKGRVICGVEDDIFPLADLEKSCEVMRNTYESIGKGERCQLVKGNSGHQFYPDDVWPVAKKLYHPHLKCRRLRRDTCRHEIRVSYPHPHSRIQPVEPHRSAKSIQNDRILGHIEPGNRGGVSVSDGSEASVISIDVQNAANGDIL